MIARGGLLICAAALASCGPASAPQPPGLALTITGSETSPNGRICAFDIEAANRLGQPALNVQVAYSARTTSDSTLSEYVVLGDFAADETRTGRIFVTGAACDGVASLRFTRAVCTLRDDAGETSSCADAVTLEGSGVVEMHAE